MKSLPTITDPRYVARPHSAFDRFFLRFLKDERDLPFGYLVLKLTLLVLPLAGLLYVPAITGWAWWALAVGYLYLNNVVFKGPFGLMLHCTSHRPLFRKEYDGLNKYIPWVLAPFFGQTPETYYSHHIGMHHVENNLADDDSSTMPYQRDSLRGFLRYYVDFMAMGLRDLMDYLRRKNRRKLMRNAFAGEMLFFGMVAVLAWINLPATLVVFIGPFLIFRLITMLGNWTQHAFIDASDPGNPFKNSITCINVRYNHKCWNDGYHISHHQRPGMHWTEHPDHFLKTLGQYAQHRAIVFDGLDFGRVFFCLMRKRYDVLARHVVNINNTFGSDEEIVAMLRQRTRPVPFTAATTLVPPAARVTATPATL